MSVAASHQGAAQPTNGVRDAVVQGVPALDPSSRFLIDIDRLDLSSTFLDRDGIAPWIPHRDEMALLDEIVWKSRDNTHGVARKRVRDDEFWVRGHFPGRAMLPGVLMVEAGAQLGCFLYNVRQPRTVLAAFLRIDNVVFRRAVEPGEDLYLLAREVKCSTRRFVSEIQGVVDGQLAFEASITGMNLGPSEQQG
ncbi:MAG: hypothetical protein R3B57_00785 [Phycisphaerales bacterium]